MKGAAMSDDLPPEVVAYFKARKKDLKKLDGMPKIKHAFKNLPQEQLAAIGMLNTLGLALEAEDDAALAPEERLQKYIYAIH
jgi:hypothetical protein